MTFEINSFLSIDNSGIFIFLNRPYFVTGIKCIWSKSNKVICLSWLISLHLKRYASQKDIKLSSPPKWFVQKYPISQVAPYWLTPSCILFLFETRMTFNQTLLIMRIKRPELLKIKSKLSPYVIFYFRIAVIKNFIRSEWIQNSQLAFHTVFELRTKVAFYISDTSDICDDEIKCINGRFSSFSIRSKIFYIWNYS